MSLFWVIRLGLVVVLFALVGSSRLLLGNRSKYQRILENTPLAILEVVAYNACCYLLVALPADPTVLTPPPILAVPAVAVGLQVIGGIALLAGTGLVLATAWKRRVIGGQDTKEGLITSGVYGFARHPIYLGIALISLSLALVTVNFDGMMVLPLVFLANLLQSEVEERHDVGERFQGAYETYRRATPRFGPWWLWFALAGGVLAVLVFGSPRSDVAAAPRGTSACPDASAAFRCDTGFERGTLAMRERTAEGLLSGSACGAFVPKTRRSLRSTSSPSWSRIGA